MNKAVVALAFATALLALGGNALAGDDQPNPCEKACVTKCSPASGSCMKKCPKAKAGSTPAVEPEGKMSPATECQAKCGMKVAECLESCTNKCGKN